MGRPTHYPEKRIVARKKRMPEEKRLSGQKEASKTLWEAFRLPSVADLTARYEGYPVRTFKEY